MNLLKWLANKYGYNLEKQSQLVIITHTGFMVDAISVSGSDRGNLSSHVQRVEGLNTGNILIYIK